MYFVRHVMERVPLFCTGDIASFDTFNTLRTTVGLHLHYIHNSDAGSIQNQSL